ncbi:MAG: hypothetical protein GF331_10200 [Chitinivibrionales bacterium]|nr:hypothetical protein [Chitinivibrionales bacterium]
MGPRAYPNTPPVGWAGMPLEHAVVMGNPLASLGPFEGDPPPRCVCDTVAREPGYAETVLAQWERRGDTLSARLSRTAIAFRRGDRTALRQLASVFAGHSYLYVPVSLTFAQAGEAAARLGGHVVTTARRDEHDFVLGLLPYAEAVWLGIDVTTLPIQWRTGESITFERFPNSHERTLPMPKHLHNYSRNDANWYAARDDEATAGLVIEWED